VGVGRPVRPFVFIRSALSIRDENSVYEEDPLMAWAAAAAILAVGISFLFNRRAAYFLIAAIAVLGGILILATVLQNPQRGDRRDAVSATAIVDPAACPDPAMPISVEVRNDNDNAVQRISFSLVGKLKGHSSVSYRGFLRDDKIIGHGQTSKTCYALLPLGFTQPRPQTIVPGDYDWSVDISLVDFTPR
jgi:hypothetical protein